MSARNEAMWSQHATEQMLCPANVPGGFEIVQEDGQLRRIEGDPLQGLLSIVPWTSALDIGCGTGLFVNYFRGEGKRYVGLDRNAAMIDGARQRWERDAFPVFVLYDPLDAGQLPFGDGEFDFVFSCAVLQHNAPTDREIILAEVRRILRLGGTYVFYEETYRPDNPTPSHGEGYADDWGYTEDGWKALMRRFGFEPLFPLYERAWADPHVFWKPTSMSSIVQDSR